MENQHRKITGYRDLTQANIDLMNKIKAHAVVTEALAKEVDDHVMQQLMLTNAPKDDPYRNLMEAERLEAAQPRRWVSISRTDFQTGFMALTRAVAQPTTF